MIVSAPNDFTEMVNMGTRLAEGVRESRLSREEASTNKKYGSGFSKKKDGETNSVTVDRRRKPYMKKSSRSHQQHHQVSSVIPMFANNFSIQSASYNKYERKKVTFDPTLMSYAELYPSLIVKNLVQPRSPSPKPEPLSWWYKHDIENFYPLKYEVQWLVISGMVSFKDRAPNVKVNLLPAHGNFSANMVDGCPNDVNPCGCVIVKRDIQRLMDEGMVHIHQARNPDDDVNVIVLVFKTPKLVVIQYGSSKRSIRSVSSLVIRLVGSIPYESDKFMPYKYNATMIKYRQEVPLPLATSVVSIADIVKSGESRGLKNKDDNDEVLRLIKKSELKVVEKLLQTPSKISVLSLLMNSEAHREALQKVLEQAYVEHDVTVDQFDHIIANITSCNNLSFYDEELPEEGRNHNQALHISMNYKEDALSKVLVDTGSSLNVLPKSTLAKLSYQGAPMRYSGVIVKAFDGSCKIVIGEVDLPIKIGVIMSTPHQKIKFVKNGKVVIVGDEKALLVSHLSSFTYVEAEEAIGTPFQALTMANVIQKTGSSMSSLKDAQEIVQAGDTDNWGCIVEVVENRNRAGLGFKQGPFKKKVKDMQQIFHSRGFIHKEEQHLVVILHEDEDEEEDGANFVTHGQICNSWVGVDVPVIIHS
ncbi:uncharacterized protein LOC127102949 [Lathyrus oleraceus]|uniref:uncharacterized protein LOC127102949 n=1 Tax=Pisum sativum TaxID=3888 RepID=UPI0021CFD0A0|nr:uncharacterized protein LOC127102949 [Pisum sativum]